MGNIPQTVGRFEIIEELGRGAMGVVYKARDPAIGRTVAIKMVALSQFLNEEQREEFKDRFFREARAAGALSHPNAVSIYDIDEHDGVPFMAIEFIDGMSLSGLIESRGAVSCEDALSITRQVAGALANAHEAGIIHRDIKPDNILIDAKGRAVVTDFGVARMEQSNLTRTGEVLGTPFFMSPEQVLGESIDGRSDIFSLGVVLYLMLTGARPFAGDSISSVCYHIVHSDPAPFPRDKGIPPAAAAILERMLAKKREDRFANADDVAAALDPLLPGTQPSHPAVSSAMSGATTAMPSDGLRLDSAASRPQPPAASQPQTGAQRSMPERSQTPAAPPPPEKKRSSAWLWVLILCAIPAAVVAVVLGVFLAAKTAPAVKKKPAKRPPAAATNPETPPPATPSAATADARLRIVFECKLNSGRLVVFVDGEPLWDKPFTRGRGDKAARVEMDFPLAAGEHNIQIEVEGRPRYSARGGRKFVLEKGRDLSVIVEAKRGPPRLAFKKAK